MNVAVIGTGYVGLTTGVTLAYLGHKVSCIDVDQQKIDKLNQGIPPIYEKGLEPMLRSAKEYLIFTTSYEEAIPNADVIFIAVGTPSADDGSPNLEYLYNAFDQTLRFLKDKQSTTVLVNKSTVPVGTGDALAEKVLDVGCNNVLIASNPEFLRQGRAMYDTLYPERIVVGGDEAACRVLGELYAPLIEQNFASPNAIPRPMGMKRPLYLTVDRKSAEMGKYAANAFLAMKISFINEIANVCDNVGGDVEKIAQIIGSDQRIGPQFLQAGIGYGGSCFPKDTRGLHHIAQTNGYSFKLLNAVIEVNNEQKFRVINKLKGIYGSLKNKKTVVLGLTFKPDTDDLRDAPSLPIIRKLLDEGADVWVHDPVASQKVMRMFGNKVTSARDLETIFDGAMSVILITEWEQYIQCDWEHLGSLMKNKVVIDGRNALDGKKLTKFGYRYIGVGRSIEI